MVCDPVRKTSGAAVLRTHALSPQHSPFSRRADGELAKVPFCLRSDRKCHRAANTSTWPSPVNLIRYNRPIPSNPKMCHTRFTTDNIFTGIYVRCERNRSERLAKRHTESGRFGAQPSDIAVHSVTPRGMTRGQTARDPGMTRKQGRRSDSGCSEAWSVNGLW